MYGKWDYRICPNIWQLFRLTCPTFNGNVRELHLCANINIADVKKTWKVIFENNISTFSIKGKCHQIRTASFNFSRMLLKVC
jgi:hypothetical protein